MCFVCFGGLVLGVETRAPRTPSMSCDTELPSQYFKFTFLLISRVGSTHWKKLKQYRSTKWLLQALFNSTLHRVNHVLFFNMTNLHWTGQHGSFLWATNNTEEHRGPWQDFPGSHVWKCYKGVGRCQWLRRASCPRGIWSEARHLPSDTPPYRNTWDSSVSGTYKTGHTCCFVFRVGKLGLICS
jgi:hypothetical protein